MLEKEMDPGFHDLPMVVTSCRDWSRKHSGLSVFSPLQSSLLVNNLAVEH